MKKEAFFVLMALWIMALILTITTKLVIFKVLLPILAIMMVMVLPNNANLPKKT